MWAKRTKLRLCSKFKIIFILYLSRNYVHSTHILILQNVFFYESYIASKLDKIIAVAQFENGFPFSLDTQTVVCLRLRAFAM